MKKKKTLGIIGLLVLLDQSIKLYIKYNHFSKNFNIIGEFVQFKPVINDAYSWVNSMLNLGINRIIHIIFVIIALILIYVSYQFIWETYSKSKWLVFSYVMIMSAAICSFIDKVFWGGSLDYIYFKSLFIFDLKDVYVSIFEIVVIGLLIFNFRKINSISTKNLLGDFKTFILQEGKKLKKNHI